MENSPRRDLREALALKFGNRAREANTPVLEEALAIRARIAAVFGASSWAHHRMVTKMAGRPEAVTDFYASIHERLSEAGVGERAALERLLDAEGHAPPVQPWDRAFCHTQQMKRDYGVDPLEVAAYFPLERVIAGMFDLTQGVFGLTYQPVDAPAWHEEVLAYRIIDSASGAPVAHFFMDLHPREGKFGHGRRLPAGPRRYGPPRRQPPAGERHGGEPDPSDVRSPLSAAA